MTSTLISIFGSESGSGVLAFLTTYQEGYASEIARYTGLDLYAVQKQLEKFQSAGLLRSRAKGRLRMYAFDPRHPLHDELKSLIDKAAALEKDRRKAAPPKSLPDSLRPFFWDYRFEDLSWEANRDLVIRRLLTNGSWEALTWLRARLGDRELRKWLIAQRGRELSPRQLRYWSLVLRLPKRQVDAWTRAAGPNPWSRR